MAKNVRSRGWVLTVQVQPGEVLLWTKIHEEFFESGVWSIRQLEIAPTTRQYHIQGAIYFKSARSFDVLQKRVPGAHIEPMKGTCQQSKTYCTKDETRALETRSVEFGEMPQQGTRTDLSSFVAALTEGASLRAVALSNPETFIRYHRGLQTFSTLLLSEREHMTKMEISWGPTGSGKSTGVRALLKEEKTKYFQLCKSMVSSNGVVWCDSYNPIEHDTMVIDDFYGWIPLHFFLNMVDSHPMLVQTKGGAVPFLCKRIMITSNDDPKNWYKTENMTRSVAAAYSRRLQPPWSVVTFVGYGPNKDQTHCVCKDSLCVLLHAESEDQAGIALARGAVLPPATNKRSRVAFSSV